MYIYLPDEASGSRTLIDIYCNGMIYKGYAEVATDHSAEWHFLSEEDDPDPPGQPDPGDTGDTEKQPDAVVNGLVIHWGADSNQYVKIKLPDMHTEEIGIPDGWPDVSTRKLANDSIKYIDKAINFVSIERAKLGAFQNRLEHLYNSNLIATENLQSAESSIRDVDMAKEMMEFTKNNILNQASQAMLAQAQQLPQGVLQLLR